MLPYNAVSPAHPFSGFVLNLNVTTLIHRDGGDKELCVVLVLSDCVGGELCLKEPGVVLDLRLGNLVIFPSTKISHFNLHFAGKRASIVFYTDKEIERWASDQNGWRHNVYLRTLSWCTYVFGGHVITITITWSYFKFLFPTATTSIDAFALLNIHPVPKMPPKKKMTQAEMQSLIQAQKKQLKDQQKIIGMVWQLNSWIHGNILMLTLFLSHGFQKTLMLAKRNPPAIVKSAGLKASVVEALIRATEAILSKNPWV